MNIVPLIGFWYRHHDQLSALVADGKNHGMVLDFLKTNLPLIKKYYPQLNANGILDDLVTTLGAMQGDYPGEGYPDPTQR